jgi:uncharacterized protein YodC (DUF2158 family)
MVAGISFPLIVQAYYENTRTVYLKGNHPESGTEVLVPNVCLSELQTPGPPVEPVYAIGQFARLKSHGPLMTVAEVRPPLPNAPEGTGTTLVCWYFGDARMLYISDKRCSI